MAENWYEEENTTYTSDVEYNKSHCVTDVLFDRSNAEAAGEETSKQFNELGLEKQHFKIHSTKQYDIETLKQEINIPNKNIYVLLHGWTGTNEIWDSVHKQPDMKTTIEQILEKDPNALIITPDGPGFGQTEMQDMPFDKLVDKVSPDAYADQIEFVLKNQLGITEKKRKNVFMMGHSWGGAATLMVAAKGYVPSENCIAIAPALLPKFEPKKFLKDPFSKMRATYFTLGGGLDMGDFINQYIDADKLTNRVIDSNQIDMLMRKLMGTTTSGELTPEEMDQNFKELKQIHGKEMRKTKISAAVMMALARGTDFSNINEVNQSTAYNRMGACSIMVGDKDDLAPRLETSIFVTGKSENTAITSTLEGAFVVHNAGHYSILYGGKTRENDPVFHLLLKAVEKSKNIETLRMQNIKNRIEQPLESEL